MRIRTKRIGLVALVAVLMIFTPTAVPAQDLHDSIPEQLAEAGTKRTVKKLIATFRDLVV